MGKVEKSGLLALSVACGMAMTVPASADIVYQPVNPAFGGNPLNGTYLLQSAGAQNQPQSREARRRAAEAEASGITGQTPAQEFAATLQRRLLFAVSDRIVESIFGDQARPEGRFEVEGTIVDFRRVGNNVELVINDGVNTTQIVVPVAF